MAQLAYTVSGDPQRPAILFLHGFMGSAEDWRGTAAAFEDRYRCIAPDLPGHGSSLGLPPDTYTTEGAARALLQTLDELNVDRATLVGYSMGGRLALYLALRHPERCSKLFLESVSPGIEDDRTRQTRRIADEERALRLETGDFDTFLRDWYGQPVFESLTRHEGLLARTMETRRRNKPTELAHSLRGMGTGVMPPLWSELANLTVPTLAVTGELDEKFVAIADRMKTFSPYLDNTSVPNAGHNVQLEAENSYHKVLEQFLTT